MNVMRQWLDYHWYDFESDTDLLQEIQTFLTTVRSKNMQKWARPMLKVIARNSSCEEEIPKPHFKDPPPPIEWHVTHDKNKFSMMSLHPVEIARQITIKEFDLFRQVTFYIYFGKCKSHFTFTLANSIHRTTTEF